MSLFVERCEVRQLMNDVEITARPLVEKKGNKLEIRYGDGVGSMSTDVTKVRQMLLNLLSNASKFTENGRVTLDVEIEPPGRWIRFTVTDTGIGMTPEQVGRLFVPFQQADAATTRKYGGTGLGLALTRHFAQMMGGDINVESAAGEGTSFMIRIPTAVRHGTVTNQPIPIPLPESDFDPEATRA
jgi:signal transduction histidine kinase